jgi:hypothetical protein
MWHLQIFIFCSAKGMCGSCVDPGKIIITAIDPLFRSAARFYGRRTIGIVLSGMLDDGAAGLIAIKKAGGIAMVQDPNDALFPDTPSNALGQSAIPFRKMRFRKPLSAWSANHFQRIAVIPWRTKSKRKPILSR